MTEVTKEFIQKNEDEKIIEIEIERLRSFKNHPFQVKDDKEMQQCRNINHRNGKSGLQKAVSVRCFFQRALQICWLNGKQNKMK